MTALDANVIVRVVVTEDAEQTARVRALFDTLTPEEPGYVCREAVLQTVWVLRSRYRMSRAHVAAALLQLFSSNELRVEDETQVRQALLLSARGGPDFGDQMIRQKAVSAGARLATFDRRLSREDGVDFLAPFAS